ncbi:MAG TPA: DUF4837 family protein [Candidatus Marinimicrobia bacterium]|nr:DUF4837 family protein [Candidatus Neomarinimicrobiota bacterium]
MRALQNLLHKLKRVKFRPPVGGLENVFIASLLTTFPALIKQILLLFYSHIRFRKALIMKKIITILSISTLLFMTGCGKRTAMGADDELIVLAALEDRGAALSILGKIFSDTLYTPAPEPYYKAKFVLPGEIEKIRNHPNLIVISVNNDLTNPGTRLVKQILPEKTYAASKNSQKSFIISKDVYAKKQTMLVISGSSTEELVEKAQEIGKKIYNQFDQQFIDRQSRFLFNRARKKELEEKIFNQFGFGLKIPWGFIVVKDSADAKLFWIGKENPFRWIVVHWEDGMVIKDQEDAERFSRQIPKRFFNHIRYVDYKFSTKPVIFSDWSGWRVTGLWESVKEAQGGPFIAYTFYDGITDRTYYIQTLIFNPGLDKYLLLRRLDIIAQTFYVEKND